MPLMSLTGENRTLVRLGLEALRNTQRPGLRALLHEAGMDEKPLSSPPAPGRCAAAPPQGPCPSSKKGRGAAPDRRPERPGPSPPRLLEG